MLPRRYGEHIFIAGLHAKRIQAALDSENASDFRLSDIQQVFDVRRNKNWNSELLADLPEELVKIWINISKLGSDDVPNYCDFR